MPSFTVYYGIKISYYFAIETWNGFIFELINLLLLSFTVYYGMKISYYFAIKEWNDFTFELQFFDNKSEHIYFVLEIFLKYIIIFYIFDQPGDWWVAAGEKYCGWHQDYSEQGCRSWGGTVCSNGFYADIWSQHQMPQYKSYLKSFL